MQREVNPIYFCSFVGHELLSVEAGRRQRGEGGRTFLCTRREIGNVGPVSLFEFVPNDHVAGGMLCWALLCKRRQEVERPVPLPQCT